jgi:hypothetical protein
MGFWKNLGNSISNAIEESARKAEEEEALNAEMEAKGYVKINEKWVLPEEAEKIYAAARRARETMVPASRIIREEDQYW